ncbi:ABC transporter ATP-binding protein [Tumebacillus flagellatus]|uniref:Bacitracin ABC transporter ATP-binding protein n=1 Tax=Tumebacillus flagellatus TaxID=1157490 RepID=A0A074LK76_9BACL|nr:ABC transporter ATP-binding protein [Tumebacillus flagellatus]KEO81000.1 bacitracin ABC transporter ATP-binding protein [Tumebacillus flagellatus]
MIQPVVEIRGLTKEIGGKVLVDDLSLDVLPGEVLGLLGPNGAGKTTTIRMIVGLISRTEGTVTIGGIDLDRDFEGALAQVGAIVENPEMYKFMTGWQNLLHFARMSKGVTEQRIEEVSRLVGLAPRIHDRVKTYSLGMRQRLGLAQALLHRPRVLILDEPTNGLDPAGIRELRDHLRRLAEQEGIAVLVSSHLLAEMELMCDRVAVMQNGQLVRVQTLREMVGENAAESGRALQVTFEVDDEAAALAVLESSTLTLQIPREQIPHLNAKLVGAGIGVYGIRTSAKTLEDKFLELTGGGGIG